MIFIHSLFHSYVDEGIKRYHGRSSILQRNYRRLRETNTEESGTFGRRHVLHFA